MIYRVTGKQRTGLLGTKTRSLEKIVFSLIVENSRSSDKPGMVD